MEVVLACMKGVSAKEKAATPKPNNDETAASLEKFAEIGTSGGWMG